jgi:4a-hydroxytetrahydrobiopterin dehydratase
MSDLATRTCTPCTGAVSPMDLGAAEKAVAALSGWTLAADGRAVTRRWEFKGFARAVQMANLAAWLGENQGHHPEVRFGWGYCEVTFTTHAANGLTENDLICAARLNAITDH